MCSWRQGLWGFGLTLTKIDIWQPGRKPSTSWYYYQSNEKPSSRAQSTGAVASKSRPLFNTFRDVALCILLHFMLNAYT